MQKIVFFVDIGSSIEQQFNSVFMTMISSLHQGSESILWKENIIWQQEETKDKFGQKNKTLVDFVGLITAHHHELWFWVTTKEWMKKKNTDITFVIDIGSRGE